MTDETLEERLAFLADSTQYRYAPMPTYKGVAFPTYFDFAVSYINRLKSANQLAETQLREILTALYKQTAKDKSFTLYQGDILEIAIDYGVKLPNES